MGKWACLSLTAKTVADHRHYEEVQPVDGVLYCTSNLQDETSLRPSYSVGNDVHIPPSNIDHDGGSPKHLTGEIVCMPPPRVGSEYPSRKLSDRDDDKKLHSQRLTHQTHTGRTYSD